jgi:hypothetical protein
VLPCTYFWRQRPGDIAGTDIYRIQPGTCADNFRKFTEIRRQFSVRMFQTAKKSISCIHPGASSYLTDYKILEKSYNPLFDFIPSSGYTPG